MFRPKGRVWRRLRGIVLKRDSARCVECGSVYRLQVDHIWPLFKGGSNSLDNLRTLCYKCHKDKTLADADVRPVKGRDAWLEYLKEEYSADKQQHTQKPIET